MFSFVLNCCGCFFKCVFVGELQRKIGLKTIEVSGNAVIG